GGGHLDGGGVLQLVHLRLDPFDPARSEHAAERATSATAESASAESTAGTEPATTESAHRRAAFGPLEHQRQLGRLVAAPQPPGADELPAVVAGRGDFLLEGGAVVALEIDELVLPVGRAAAEHRPRRAASAALTALRPQDAGRRPALAAAGLNG